MIVIPLKYQPVNEELRYCLRAIEKYHPEQEVMIVGYAPKLIKHILHVPHNDHPYPYKDRSIYEKIVTAFKYFDKLLFFNDDHIIQAPVDYLHHKGPMDPNSRHPNGTYTILMRNTLAQFPGCNDYDTHCPIWYEKDKFEKLAQLDWTVQHGYGIKTSYVYLNNLEGEYYPDLKFRTTIGDVEGRSYFSTDDGCDLRKLREMFPGKSKFER